MIQLSNDGYAWLNLIAVTPEKQKAMKDVMADVEKTWKEIETRSQLRKAAADLAKRVNNGATIAAIATELGTKVQTTPAFKRGDSVPDLPTPAISRVFALKKGQAASAAGGDENTRLVLQVTQITLPKEPAKEAATALREAAASQLQADIIAQYVTELQKRMSVSINQNAIDLTTGASAEAQY